MELETSTWMMIFFVISFVVSIWKVSAFLPSKVLADDDTTQEAQKHLTSLMVQTIQNHDSTISVDELYIYMIENEDFNKEKFWRFNKNKLIKLLELYYLKNPHANNIEDIYNETKT